MKTRKLVGILLLSLGTLGFISCDNESDDGTRGFMSEATIIGDSDNGYYCYFDAGGLAISYNKELEGIERGYFSFRYKEEDSSIIPDKMWYIKSAHVSPFTPDGIYDVIHPISIEEAKNKEITDKDNSIPPLFSLDQVFGGYLDINAGLSLVNLQDVERVPAHLNVVYDLEKQTPDSLKLQIYYHQPNPEEWTNTCFHYNTASCDLSSLSTLVQWKDSVTIVVEVGGEEKHYRRISKESFLKPGVRVE